MSRNHKKNTNIQAQMHKNTFLNLNFNNWMKECKKKVLEKCDFHFPSLVQGDPNYIFRMKWS